MVDGDSQEGFTILETLIAFIILAATLVISAQIVAVAATSISISQERSEVLQLATKLRLETAGINEKRGSDLQYPQQVRNHSIATTKGESVNFTEIIISTPLGRYYRFVYYNPITRQDR